MATATLRWPVRRWLVLLACVATAVSIAVTVGADRTGDRLPAAAAVAARHLLDTVPATPRRTAREDYQRSAFGTAWTDAVPVLGGHNGCDTRNDILRRDLTDLTLGPKGSCPQAVLGGDLRSPYTGEFIAFRRDRGAAAVQIDHIVPLAYVWDQGGWGWPADRRAALANDPANLVAVDAPSNQAKSDAEPAVWMPPLRGFRCRYAIQFVGVAAAYRLALDAPSWRVLAATLDECRG
ncbi:MAG: HNH endonuclease family protein [Gordonia sp. (in: high G+C Gram-positive bacteria)]